MRKRDRIKVYHVAVCACLGHITCLVVCRHTRQEVPTARITNSSHLRRGTVLILEARLYRLDMRDLETRSLTWIPGRGS